MAKSILSGGSPCLVVMVEGLCSEGHGFESSAIQWMDIFSHLFAVKIVSPNFHWQKKFVDRWSQFNSQIYSRENVTISLQVSLTRLGYLDVAIVKIFCKTCMPSCAIDSWQRLFRCSHREKFLQNLRKNLNICQWNTWKSVARVFGHWKSGLQCLFELGRWPLIAHLKSFCIVLWLKEQFSGKLRRRQSLSREF